MARTELFDPLAFDLLGATKQLLIYIHENDSLTFKHLIDLEILKNPATVARTDLLNAISKLLFQPNCTIQVVKLFRPILIDLIGRWNLPGFTASFDSLSSLNPPVYTVELVAKAFSYILPLLPQVKNLAVKYFTRSNSLFERLDRFNEINDHLSNTVCATEDIQDLLLTTYRLLSFSITTFSSLWNWGPVIQLLKYPDTRIQYITVLCLSRVYNFSDLQQKSLLSSIVGKPLNETDEPLYLTIKGNQIDLRFLDLWDQKETFEQQAQFFENNYLSERQLLDADLCSHTCNLCGVLFPKEADKEQPENFNPRLILTNTTSKNLHAISLALSIGAPTLLEGVTGAGKTCLIEEIAWRTNRGSELVKIHLGDQTDPKVLLGTYVSTSVPGSFQWQAGVLTTAVLEGRWVLVEDIDLAPAEVLSILLPLLETRHLFIPSRGEKIKAKEGFHLFSTRSFTPSRSNQGANARGGVSMPGANLWTRVYVEPLTPAELEHVVRERFTYIQNFAPHAINLFQTVSNIYEDPNFVSLSSSTMGRFLSTRDLMKWCHRINLLIGEKLTDSSLGMDLTLRQDLFNEANDCFCGMISDYSTWETVLQAIGKPLQISSELVQNYIDQYKPALNIADGSVRVGRVNLSSFAADGKQKKAAALIRRQKQRPFATTGHALRLMEKIAVAIHLNEPVLLVGETGTGKTTVIQHLADMVHQNLIVVNLSQQSDSSDLLGGFKPVDGKVLAIPLYEEFNRLFEKTFSVKKNAKFLEMARKMFIHKKWINFVALLKQSIKMSQQKFESEQAQEGKKISLPEVRLAWKKFEKHLEEFEVQQAQSQNNFVFNFMEGSLVKAVRQGDWILLDEMNLATTETLECLSGLLQDVNGSLLLTEKGEVEPIQRHPNFRLFACMNPATDVGKRDLPPGLRNRFTEFYIHPPDNRYDDLMQIVKQYIYGVASGDERCYDDIVNFYMSAKKLSNEHKLVDGANQRPHFSMRTLARALSYVVQVCPTYGLRRSMYEGFCMTFLTLLDRDSEELMHKLICNTLLRSVQNSQNLVTKIPRQPGPNFVQCGHFWLEQGQLDPVDDPRYILTKSIEAKLYNLARVIVARKFPVLIQGPTSAGKTSMVEYIAKKTGHRFVRINNHEHTDLQEYLGTYVSNNDGKLVFQEGVLVEALRNGYWIVLDELNLAPSDVLEALNRLLDDNRELLIPETQEIIKPHPHFMLFATQNPAGLYGGRKALSRAFRNRFLELHFDDIPEDELESILSQRCSIAPSYCKKLVMVYQQLMAHRQSTRIFEQKHGFITLRDLFRWAGRDSNGYQELAENGYMLLAERCRRLEEKKVVKQVLGNVMKVKIDENNIYNPSHLEEFQSYDRLRKQNDGENKLVWTKAMCRLFSLVARCIKHNEPVLLVGDTGCGKTTVCQMLAEVYEKELQIVNCHQNTETGDLLGGQRPVREQETHTDKPKQLFEWHDGPLVQSMKNGHLFLLDEISLADDSVLERLNSVLEPSRLLVLAEKGGKEVEELYAVPGFKFLATMNPGGDYGKKELSPALRNRFTEIWVPSVTDRDDLINIIEEQLESEVLKGYSAKMLDFIAWYSQALGQRTVVSLRDILSWVKFMNIGIKSGINADISFAHGGCIVLLDGLGSHGSSSSFMTGRKLKDFRLKCLRFLSGKPTATEKQILGNIANQVCIGENELLIGPFKIDKGSLPRADLNFTLEAPTTSDNAMRAARAMQLRKPILLEGSPGVGKTSLVSALASASGHHLVRINLSEQTDLMDLFGSDLPVEGGNSGEFAWRDAPFLQAMKAGDWVLLDELNLASQSVLEGLNSCLDHRGAVYVPELDREFFCHPKFRVFGAQNPLQQGGGRKGLPKSFVNRFTQVYVEQLTSEDLLFICSHLFPEFESVTMTKMIEFNYKMYEETMVRCSFGRAGSPWEFNLRDVFRWLELMRRNNVQDPSEFLDTVYLQRMRTQSDRDCTASLFESVFEVKYKKPSHPVYKLSTDTIQVGNSSLNRKPSNNFSTDAESQILQSFLLPLQSLMKCVESSWMAILTGPVASGKTSIVRLLSKLTGNSLQEFAMNSSVDTMELLGGFEQVDLNRHRSVIMDSIKTTINLASKSLLMYSATVTMNTKDYNTAIQLTQKLNDIWFVLESKQTMRSKDSESYELDYVLIENILVTLKSATAVDTTLQEHIEGIVAALENLQKLEKSTVAGKFEWIDGLLINALENGHWLLVDNANLCNPSVLDRLNSLFENDGVLMINERGLVDGTVKIIKPHPNFRMFMTVNPQNGELSRAMRNRGIEIALLSSNWNENELDATKIGNSIGIRSANLPTYLRTIQEEVVTNLSRSNKSDNVRDYIMFATYLVERLQRGQSLNDSLCGSFFQVFVDVDNIPQSLIELVENGFSCNQILSPTNTPFLITGSLYERDSNLAMVMLYGAYFVYLIQTVDSEDTYKLEVASDYILECLTQDNYGLFYRWLGYMSQHIPPSTAMDRLVYILKEVYIHPLFIELSKTEDKVSDRLHEVYKLLIRSLKHQYLEHVMKSATSKLKIGHLTAVQQSFCFQQGRLSESQLWHPVVSKIYPLFESIQAALRACISEFSHESCSSLAFRDINHLLNIRDFTWSLTEMETISLDRFLISLRLMSNLISKNNAPNAELLVVNRTIQDIMGGFDFETSESMKTLWKYYHPSTLSSPQMNLLEVELRKIDNSLNCYKFDSEECLNSKALVLHAKMEAKESLVEGLATLYSIDMNDSKSIDQALDSLKELPKYINSELDLAKSELLPEDTIWSTALVPLLDYKSMVEEMDILAHFYALTSYNIEDSIDTTLIDRILRFKKFSLLKSSRPPLDILPYQRLAWHLDSGLTQKYLLPGMLQDASFTHHQRLWRSSLFQKDLYCLIPEANPNIEITEGSLSLFQSVETFACLNILGSLEQMPVEAYDIALKQLKNLQQYLTTNSQTKDRECLEIVALLSAARQLIDASASTFSQLVVSLFDSAFNEVAVFINQMLQSTLYTNFDFDVLDLSQKLTNVYNLAEQFNLNKYFKDAINAIRTAVEALRIDNQKLLLFCGKARALLGLAFVSAYIPDYPADPTSEPRLRVDLLLQQKQRHEDYIVVRENIEKIHTGSSTNHEIEREKALLTNIQDRLKTVATAFSLRPEKSQLEDIFVDLRYLQKSIIEQNVDKILTDLEANNTENVLQREAVLQGNALQFVDRIHDKFPLYRDFLQPLIVAVDDIKYGLRLMTSQHHSSVVDKFLSGFIQLLVFENNVINEFNWYSLATPKYVELIKSIVFERASTSRKWAFYLRVLIVVLQRIIININTSAHLQLQDIDAANVLFSEIVQIWKAAEKHKASLEAEKEALYKTRAKKYEPPTEEDLQEQDLKDIFANFESEYADLDVDNDESQQHASTPIKVEEFSVLDADDINYIGYLHHSMFELFRNDACQRSQQPFDREMNRSYLMASELASLVESPFSYTFDSTSRGGHLRSAALAVRRLESGEQLSVANDSNYDFYKSENVGEAKKVKPLVERFKIRVQELVDQWPEHAILDQLITVCDRLLTFPIMSPIAKFLTGIELLLQKSEDWEAYAAKHVSLQAQREELVALIVHWRQLELNCWPKLLDAQKAYHQDTAFKWWFHLYDTIHNTVFDSKEEFKSQAHDLLGALDQFMQTSSIVEFTPRLNMIKTFYLQTKSQAQFSVYPAEKLNFTRIYTILRNVHLYYCQFTQHVDLMMAQMRKPIEKDLKDFVKIATWKDVNIHALKQSATKTHRKLHKCICKYREALNTTMMTVIANYNQEQAMYQYGDEKRYADLNLNLINQISIPNHWTAFSEIRPGTFDWSHIPVKQHLNRLPSTLSRLRAYCKEDIFIVDNEAKQSALENLMLQMITQIKDFQKQTPSTLTDENKSLVINQKLLKKKALVDFLKELRRLGLKSRSNNIRESNSDTKSFFTTTAANLNIMENPNIKMLYNGSTSEMCDQWNKANDYYYRCIARLTHLRTVCTTEASKDLSSLEVERSITATEHMFYIVNKERRIFAQMEERIQILQGAGAQLFTLYEAFGCNQLSLGNICESVIEHKIYIDRLVLLLGQAFTTISFQNLGKPVQDVKAIYCQAKEIQVEFDKHFVQGYLYPKTATHLDFTLMSPDVVQLIEKNKQELQMFSPVLANAIEALPQFSHVLFPVMQYVTNIGQEASILSQSSDSSLVQLREKVQDLIDSVLISVQDLRKVTKSYESQPSSEEEQYEDMCQNFLLLQSEKQFKFLNALHIESVSKRSLEILTLTHCLLNKSLEKPDLKETYQLLQEAYPFLQQYMLIVQNTLARMLLHHKSMAKFTYCLVNSFNIIITKGFCMPAGLDNDEEGSSEGKQTGTGIGEGEGSKDVSHEIEDEEQVLGTQNEERSDEKQDTKEEKDGMDMENDFEGNLEDVEQEQEDDDDNSDSSDDDDEPDEQIGDVDDTDPDAVDDKMWDEGEENLNESDKTVDDQGQQQSNKEESDIVAKDEEENASSDKNKEEETTDNNDNGKDDEEDKTHDDDGLENEEDLQNQPGEQLDTEIPEAETLDLPEDLAMDEDLDLDNKDEENQDDGELENEDAMDVDEMIDNKQDEEQNEELGEEQGEEQGEAFHDALDDMGEDQTEDHEMADASAEMDTETNETEENAEDQEETEKDSDEKETQNAKGDEEETNIGSEVLDEDEEMESTAQNREQPNSNNSADNQFGVQGQAGKQSQSSSGKSDDNKNTADSSESDQQADKSEAQGSNSNNTSDANNDNDLNEGEKESDAQSQDKANPERSLGDALERWKRKLKNLDGENNDESEPNEMEKEDTENAQVNENNTFEYVKNDEEAHDTQAMGAAQPDQVQDLKTALMDETQEDNNQESGEMNNETMEDIDSTPAPRDAFDVSGSSDQQGTILSKKLPEEYMVDETQILTMDEAAVSREPIEQRDIELLREELESRVSEWRQEGRDSNQARLLWQGYENLTHDLAMGLCEQLRLILEPTLATKLKGDYRTGKRLNMKKIIPYIASQFKKDKIWLRRTKMSKRQYQVMISVDDSKSMSESRSVQLAYETLALISKALSQLEVGDISITSFGEQVRLLHPFGQPFTAESGASVLQQFTFAQQKTYVKSLIQTSIDLFENAKHSSSSVKDDLWQLQLVISDGICEDHESLRSLVRSALEQRIMIIFIVMDNKPEKDSILQMTNITYTVTDGKCGIQMKPYLETFPFQYFMIVRDVASLPEALSDALRQYFSFVSG